MSAEVSPEHIATTGHLLSREIAWRERTLAAARPRLRSQIAISNIGGRYRLHGDR